MLDQPSLAQHLSSRRDAGGRSRAVVEAILALADATAAISALVSRGRQDKDLAGSTGAISDGEAQKTLDLIANTQILKSLARCSVGQVASEENDEVQHLDPHGVLAIAIDPVDGSGNIATNAPIGTIFSIRPLDAASHPVLGAFASAGSTQLAAGFTIYGSRTTLMLTVGSGVDLFVLDDGAGEFLLTQPGLMVRAGAREYAINASNARHWDEPVRRFVEDCVAGAAGPLGADYNTRWYAAMIAEAHRILLRGGVFLYPGDARPGYREGRLRLIYEAQTVAFMMEQAGGGASDGHRAISGIVPERLHQRIPLFFGARDEIARIDALHAQPAPERDVAPLFGRRGLFRS